MGATPGMQWAQLLTQMGGQQNNAIAEGTAAGTAAKGADIKQQQADLEKQQQYRQAQQWDMDTHQHLTQEGAKFADPHTGLIKDTQYEPDTSGLNNGMPIATTVMRAMNPDAPQFKFKDADGNTIQGELPTPEAQRSRQLMQLMQQNQAQAQGTAAGTAAGTPMVPTDADYNSRNNLPAGMTQIPQSGAVGLAERTVPATTRANASIANTSANVAGRQGVADTRAKTASDQQDLQGAQFQQSEDDKNKWESAKLANARYLAGLTTGRAKMTQDATDARNFRDNFERNTQLHTTLSKNILAEQQKQLGANGILGADQSGSPATPDGTAFTDPFDGKQKTMNSANRLILGQRSQASAAASTDMLKTKGQLEQQRDDILSRMAPGGAAPASGGNAPAAPAAAKPKGAPQTKTASQDQVNAYAAKKKITPAAALQEFKDAHYTVH